MKTKAEAESLGNAMREVGVAAGVTTHLCYHTMDEPLGASVGNALEVIEAMDTLQGGGPEDLREVTLSLAEKISEADRGELELRLSDGRAFAKFQEMVEAQGGKVEDLERFTSLHEAPVIHEIYTDRGGIVESVDADAVGRLCLALGAGREQADETIDFRVGMDQIVKTGAVLQAGDLVGRVHARTGEAAENAEERFWKGLKWRDNS